MKNFLFKEKFFLREIEWKKFSFFCDLSSEINLLVCTFMEKEKKAEIRLGSRLQFDLKRNFLGQAKKILNHLNKLEVNLTT